MANPIWITKYALTRGIIKTTLIEVIDDTMVTVSWPGGLNEKAYFHGNEFHFTAEKAIEAANQLVKKKCAALERQLVKLKQRRFETIEDLSGG